MKKNIFFKIFVLMIVIGLAVGAERNGFFKTVLDSVRAWGAWAPPAFLGIYILGCLLFFPSLVLTLAAGAMFPVPMAVGLCLLGNSLGSTAALLIGRYLLRGWTVRLAGQSSQFQKLDRAVRREGWKIAVLARLTPVFPFSIGNYLFGATPISAWIYGLTAFVGTVPSALVYAWAGYLASAQDGARARTPAEWVLLGAGIVATFFLSWYLKHFFDRLDRGPVLRH